MDFSAPQHAQWIGDVQQGYPMIYWLSWKAAKVWLHGEEGLGTGKQFIYFIQSQKAWETWKFYK